VIPLGSEFAADKPPAALVEANPVGPDYAFHCMGVSGGTDNTWHLMSVGGDAGWVQHSDVSPDSAWRGDLNPSEGVANYTHQATGWGNQPTRRVYHRCAQPVEGGDIFVTGGINDDGSGTTHATTYKYNSTTQNFTNIATLPLGTYHHSSVLLGNGTLINFGGAYFSTATGSPALVPFDRLYTLDTNEEEPSWNSVDVTGTLPAPRRGASATLNPDGTIFIFGGADANLSTVYSDGWLLDPATLSWTEVVLPDGGEYL
jgi:hypothetical protein